jgi:signal transduction histidine kinase
VRVAERLSIRARLRISILLLVTSVVLSLSGLQLFSLVREAFDDVDERSSTLTDQVTGYVVESLKWAQDTRGGWTDVVRNDEHLARLLQRSLARSGAVVDVLVLDNTNRVMAASDRDRIGHVDPPARSWSEWKKHGLLWQLADIFRSHSEMAIEEAIAPAGSTDPVLKVKVLLSPALIRSTIEPQIGNLAGVSALALAVSALLAIIVSRFVGNSLDRLGQKIDLIAQGDLRSVQHDRFETPELIDLETKLWWLGRQYSGARSDALHLKSSVEHVLRQVQQAIFVFGPDGFLQIAGGAAERLLARTRSDILGKSMETLFPSWTGPGTALARAVGSRQWVRDQPVTLDRPNLQPVRLLMTVEPVTYDDGPAHGTLVVLRESETSPGVGAGPDMARKLLALSRITSGVAHEIKNPLNAMMLHLEIAHEKTKAGLDGSPELEIVKSELLRLDRVVKTLLDFHSPVEVRLSECNLAEIANEVARLMRPRAEAQEMHVVVESGGPDVLVVADIDLLKQAIINIAVNGLEAMSAGGTLRFSVEETENEGILSIHDEGPGIPAEIRDKIFNLYFTTKKSGSGIGLAMTYRILQLHSGTINIQCENGQGTTCRLSLPLARSREVAA